tara:strand:+ start:2153 stop:2437 length:285 start_codon:yes stop_codon:yes gene_type:complete
MTNNMMTDRLAMIKSIAEKNKARKIRMAAIKARSNRVQAYFDTAPVLGNRKPTQNLTAKAEGESELHWTDGTKYANQHYGETLHYTTKFDNDWN